MSAGETALPTAEQVGSALDRVYSRPELQDPGESWSTRTFRSLLERLIHHVPAGSGRVIVAFGWLALALLVLVVVVLLARLLLSFVRRPWGRRGSEIVHERLAEAPRAAPSPDFLTAARLAEDGRYLEASHVLYGASVGLLAARGRVRPDEAKTGGEYARELRSAPEAASFDDLLRAYYPLAYGRADRARALYETMRRAAASMGAPS